MEQGIEHIQPVIVQDDVLALIADNQRVFEHGANNQNEGEIAEGANEGEIAE